MGEKDKKGSNLKLPIPQWAIDDSISEGSTEPLMPNRSAAALILPQSDNEDEEDTKTQSESDSKNRSRNRLLPHSDVDDADNERDEDDTDDDDDDAEAAERKVMIDMDAKPKKMKKKKQAPVAYTGFDDVSKENVAKIHGDLIQRFFHENPEDIEGHGEETQLLAMQQAVNASGKAIVQ